MSSYASKKSDSKHFDLLVGNYFSLMGNKQKGFTKIEIIGEFIKNEMCLNS